jgi:aerobic-type carbon monoxide dehydrogenase small subunit (CoxS/CutS family)
VIADVTVRVNGRPRTLTATATTSLLRALRDDGLTGTTGACEQGECGSCSVWIDGALACSCLVPALVCEGSDVRTIEGGVAEDLADALARHGAVQCGFCTPGIVMAAEALLRATPSPTRAQVAEGLAGNLCRCTGYDGILSAVVEVGRGRRG